MIPPLSNTYSDIKESECEVKQNELKKLNERDRTKEAQWWDVQFLTQKVEVHGPTQEERRRGCEKRNGKGRFRKTKPPTGFNCMHLCF